MRRASTFTTALAAAALLVVGCDDDSGPDESATTSSEATSTSSASSSSAVVEIRDNALHPEDVTIAAGGTVTWEFDDDGVVHEIQGAIFGSGRKSSGEYQFEFPEAGTSTYHCTIHPDMRGTVTVTP